MPLKVVRMESIPMLVQSLLIRGWRPLCILHAVSAKCMYRTYVAWLFSRHDASDDAAVFLLAVFRQDR